MKKSLVSTLVAGAVLLALTSCAKGAKSSGAEFILNNGAEPQSIDPSKIQGVPEDRIYTALFEGLVAYDPKTCKAVPGVAESWEHSEDGTVLTYHLRKAEWSDGTPITAQTFVDSWRYYLSPETAAEYAYMPAAIIKGGTDYNAGKAGPETLGVTAIDEQTLEVQLEGSIPYAVDVMAHYSFSPLPLHVMEKFGNDWTKPENFVGNGPFVLESWKPQERITVIPNEKYWNRENVFLDRITFLPIENDTTAYNKYKNGELDWDTNIPADLLGEIRLRDDYHVSPQLASYYYEFNVTDPVLSDVRVRKALAKAIDRQQLVEKVLGAGQIAADAFVPPMAGYTPTIGNSYNIIEAQNLLADAGYPNGEGFPKVTIIYNTNEDHKKVAEYIQQQWKENLGVEASLENLEWATFLAKRQDNDFQIARAGWVGDYLDPSNFLELCKSDGGSGNWGNNDGHYKNDEFDALLKEATTSDDQTERMAILRSAEDIMITQDQAFIPLYYYVSKNMIDTDKWDGWYMNTLDKHPYVGLKARK